MRRHGNKLSFEWLESRTLLSGKGRDAAFEVRAADKPEDNGGPAEVSAQNQNRTDVDALRIKAGKPGKIKVKLHAESSDQGNLYIELAAQQGTTARSTADSDLAGIFLVKPGEDINVKVKAGGKKAGDAQMQVQLPETLPERPVTEPPVPSPVGVDVNTKDIDIRIKGKAGAGKLTITRAS